MGDIVLVKDGETFAADLILISSASADGTAFIATSSLDGEKNLKKRSIPKNLSEKIPQADNAPGSFIFLGECESELPNSDLHKFIGKVEISNNVYPLDVNQLLLKGANLMNTPWCVGFCVYTGVDTRLMMNA